MVRCTTLKLICLTVAIFVLCGLVFFPHSTPLASKVSSRNVSVTYVQSENLGDKDKKSLVLDSKEIGIQDAREHTLEHDPGDAKDFVNFVEMQRKLNGLDDNVDKILKLMEKMNQTWLYSKESNIEVESKGGGVSKSDVNAELAEKTVWDMQQELRRKQISTGCTARPEKHKTLVELIKSRELSQNLLVDDKHKVIYCYIPKIACTEWKKIMMILGGRTHMKDYHLIPHAMAHFLNQLTVLNTLRPRDIKKKVKEYKKFVFVREPYERLLSAYVDKFVKNSTDATAFKINYAKPMMEKLRPKENVSISGEGLKFSEFLTVLSMKTSRSVKYSQEHWRPAYDLCHPCTLNYDYIGKYESLEEDSNQILKKLGSDLKFPAFKPSGTKQSLKSHLSTVAVDVLEQLYTRFEKDFVLFGYDKAVL